MTVFAAGSAGFASSALAADRRPTITRTAEDDWPVDENLPWKAQKERILELAKLRVIDTACGSDVSREQTIWADETERRFISQTRIRTRGRVASWSWVTEPDLGKLDSATRKVPWKIRAEIECLPPRVPTFSLTARLQDGDAAGSPWMAASPRNPDNPEGPIMKVGDKLSMVIRSSAAARAMVFALGSDRRVVQLVPSRLLPRLDLPADRYVPLPDPKLGPSLTITAPPVDGLQHEMIKVVAFKGEVLPPPPLPADKPGDMAPEDFDRWLGETPDDVREEALVIYRVAR